MPAEGGTDAAEAAAFTRALAALKRRGSNLLLVGAAGEPQLAACSHLLGDAVEPRRRLFVFTDAGDGIGSRLPESARRRDAVTVIRRRSLTRGATEANGTTTEADGAMPVPERTVEDDRLAALGDAIVDAIVEFDEVTAGLAPAELRVCVDSLRPLLSDHSEETLFRFLHVLTGEIRRVNGMGHFHLPIERDERPVRLLSPLFDAVVEVEGSDGGMKQRWHLRDGDLTTDWLDL